MARVVSSTITTLEAGAYPDVEQGPGLLKEKAAVAAPAANQASADTIHFFRVKSNAIVSRVMISAADATTAGAVNVGLYNTAAAGGAAVDADLFASALDLAGGPYNNLDITFESGELTYAESTNRLWEVLGLTEDPHKEYDVVATVSTTFNGGPTSIKLVLQYRE